MKDFLSCTGRPCMKNITVYAAIKGSESKWHGAT